MAGPKYKELASGFEFVRDRKGATGRRVFQRNDADGTISIADLPVVGFSKMVNEWGRPVAGCIALSSRYTFAAGHTETPVFTVSYGPPGLEGSVEHEESTSHFNVGVHQLSSPAHFWKYQGSTAKVSAPVPVEISTGTVTRVKSGLTQAKNTSFRAVMVNNMGRLNDRAFEGFARGNVKFEGGYGGSYRDADGNLRYSYELIFAYKIARALKSGSPVNDVWQKEYNAEVGGWYTVVDGSSGFKRYSYIDFETMISEPATEPAIVGGS